MGADLYIQCKMADEYEAEHQATFDAAIKERDEAIKLYGDHRVKTDDVWAIEYADPRVQIKQKKVDEASEKIWGENPYYFRDSYNGTSIMWQLELSWWQEIESLQEEQNAGLPELDDDDADAWIERNTLNAESCQKLLDHINEAAKNWSETNVTKESLKEGHCKCDSDEDVDEWRKYFVEKLDNLRNFIRRAIDLDAGIYASV